MHLSEAIRDGCRFGKQCFGAFTDGEGYCAIGAAMRAYNVPVYIGTLNIPEFFLGLVPALTPCPACGLPKKKVSRGISIPKLVYHLNDDHRWSREAIAEWVETVERDLGLWDEKRQTAGDASNKGEQDSEESGSIMAGEVPPVLTLKS